MSFCNTALAFSPFFSELPVPGNDKVTPDAPSSRSLPLQLPPRRSVVILQAKLRYWRQAPLAWGTWPFTALQVPNRSFSLFETLSDLDSKL